MQEKRRVLITGAGGMLGTDVHSCFNDQKGVILATDIDVNEEWLEHLDVRDYTACKAAFNRFKPDLVLHLAALTDLEYCENNLDEAWETNATGTQNIAKLARQDEAIMVYISTAGVFEGGKADYTEQDEVVPINEYGKSKYAGEQYVRELVEEHYIFRAGWMMGGLKKDKKFIAKIMAQIQEGSKELFVVNDKSGTPTYTVDFANGIAKVIERNNYGLYHQVCTGACTRLDVAYAILEILELQDEIKITQVSSDYFKEEYFARRPESEVLINARLDELNLSCMRDWRKCLEEYLNEPFWKL